MQVTKRKRILEKRKEKLKTFLKDTPPKKKIEILKKWYDDEGKTKRFNIGGIEAMERRSQKEDLKKGDVYFIDSVFIYMGVNPFNYT